MTREILSDHQKTQARLNKARELRKRMLDRAYPKAQTIDDMPKTTGTGRKVEEQALVLSELTDRIKELETATARTRPAILEWTRAIDNEEKMVIAQLRVLCGWEFERIAHKIGKTQDAVEKTYRRLMEGL